jgi:hypothetical protein
MIARARDRLVVASALLQRALDRLSAGRLALDQAEAVTAAILLQMQQALALMDEASAGVQLQPAWQPVPVPVVEPRRRAPW